MWVSLLIFTVTPAQAASLQLSWNAPTTDADGAPLTDLAGYKVYSGQSPGKYTGTLDVGNVLGISIGGLQDGQRYHFAVTAYDSSRNESDFSKEASAIAGSPPPIAAGLMAAYSFNKGSGSTVADVSGHGNDGTISEATWTANGRFGNALVFNGVDSWVTINDASSLDLTTGMTLEAWVYPTVTLTGWRTVIEKEQSGGTVYYLQANSDADQPATGVVIDDEQILYGGTRLPASKWTHLAATYDGRMQRLYINGIEVANQATTGAIQVSNGPVRIGGNSVWGEAFQGRIDEVRIYNRALSAIELLADMNTPIP
jgi:hypothetical protein